MFLLASTGDRTCQALRSHVLESQSPGAKAKLPCPREKRLRWHRGTIPQGTDRSLDSLDPSVDLCLPLSKSSQAAVNGLCRETSEPRDHAAAASRSLDFVNPITTGTQRFPLGRRLSCGLQLQIQSDFAFMQVSIFVSTFYI